MKREDLEKLGLEKEVIDKIMDLNGTAIEAEKKRADKAETERDEAKEQLKTTTEALDKFKDVKPDELNATIAQLQEDMKKQKDEFDAKEADRVFMETISGAIKELGGKNSKAITALLNLDELKSSKNQTEDIKKALESTKESDAYLFGVEEPIKNPVAGAGGNPLGGDSQTSMMRAAMGLPAEPTK